MSGGIDGGRFVEGGDAKREELYACNASYGSALNYDRFWMDDRDNLDVSKISPDFTKELESFFCNLHTFHDAFPQMTAMIHLPGGRGVFLGTPESTQTQIFLKNLYFVLSFHGFSKVYLSFWNKREGIKFSDHENLAIITLQKQFVLLKKMMIRELLSCSNTEEVPKEDSRIQQLITTIKEKFSFLF